jgi:tRNA (guanine37-N1)-methyltransferase
VYRDIFVCKLYFKDMKVQIITLFPEMFEGVFGASMLWKAQDKELVTLETINLRQFGIGPRKTVDDTPYGGGDGMLLKPEPLFEAVEHAKKNAPGSKVLLMTPRGYDYSQQDAKRYATEKTDLIIVCGRYEGYDERITTIVDEEISIGHFVLTGGELAAMVVVDSIVRLIPGVLGGQNSAEIESFSEGAEREYPQYTRPEEFKGLKVPEVLLSGNHAAIENWRQEQAELITKKRQNSL